jgi:hypothetical protein
MVPLEAFLPDSVMEDILDAFPYLLSRLTIESLHKDDGSFDLEVSSSLLFKVICNSQDPSYWRKLEDSWNTFTDSLRMTAITTTRIVERLRVFQPKQLDFESVVLFSHIKHTAPLDPTLSRSRSHTYFTTS